MRLKLIIPFRIFFRKFYSIEMNIFMQLLDYLSEIREIIIFSNCYRIF